MTHRLGTLVAGVMSVSLLSACSPATGDTTRDERLTQRQGLAISRQAALAAGYDLSRYALDTAGDRSGGDDKAWMFVYLCQPVPPPPGCSFMVVVDRRTGASEIVQGM